MIESYLEKNVFTHMGEKIFACKDDVVRELDISNCRDMSTGVCTAIIIDID